MAKVLDTSSHKDIEYVLNTARDSTTKALQTITYGHHEIHSGSSFVAHFDNLTANADDARSAVGFYTPNTTKLAHLVMRATVSANAEAFLLETPTIDLNEGTQKTIINRNRSSNKESGLLSVETVRTANEVTTYTEAQINGAQFSGGLELDHIFIAGGSGPKSIGGFVRADEEWVLNQNTLYVLYLQNVGAPGVAGNQHEIHLDWYEHTDRLSTE